MGEQEKDIFFRFVDHLVGMKDDVLNAMLGGKLIGCLAIVDHVDTGCVIAYESGCEHRLSKKHWAWRAVHSKTLQVISVGNTGWSAFQTVPMTPDEAKREIVEPCYLGCAVEPLFYDFAKAQYPDVALFLYPENYLVPSQEREFVHRLSQRDDFEVAVIITKSPVILSDFTQDFIWVVTG